jgi:nucleotide-binding universal stress UspA family protein
MSHPSSRSVVVGVDGSERSVEALRWAAAEASRMGSSVIAVLACGATRLTAPYAPIGPTWPTELTAPAEDRLGSIVDSAFDGHPPVPVRQVCDPRPPVPALLGYGADAAMLVLATSPGHAMSVHPGSGRPAGSTVLALVRYAPCPIVLLPVERQPSLPGHLDRETALASA